MKDDGFYITAIVILILFGLFGGFLGWLALQYGIWVIFVALFIMWIIKVLINQSDKEKKQIQSSPFNSPNNINPDKDSYTIGNNIQTQVNKSEDSISSNLQSKEATIPKQSTNKKKKSRKKKRQKNHYIKFAATFNYVIVTYGWEMIRERRFLYLMNDFHAFNDYNYLKDLFYRLYDDGVIADMINSEINIDTAAKTYSDIFFLNYHDVQDFLLVLKTLLRNHPQS